jgi:hypothetical protein
LIFEQWTGTRQIRSAFYGAKGLREDVSAIRGDIGKLQESALATPAKQVKRSYP